MDGDIWYGIAAFLFFVAFVVLLVIQFIRDRSDSSEETAEIPDNPPRSIRKPRRVARAILIAAFLVPGLILSFFGFLLSTDLSNTGGGSIAGMVGIIMLVAGVPLTIYGLIGLRKFVKGSSSGMPLDNENLLADDESNPDEVSFKRSRAKLGEPTTRYGRMFQVLWIIIYFPSVVVSCNTDMH